MPSRRRQTGRSHPPRVLAAAGASVALLSLVPLGYVVAFTVTTPVAELQRLLLRGRTVELLVDTTVLVVLGVSLCVVVGVGTAWVVERGGVAAQPLWRATLVAPLAVPAFVSSYTWISVAPGADGLAGALLVTVPSYYPLVHLPVVAMLRRSDRGLEDTARALGLGEWAVFYRVTLPQVRPAVLGGSLLVALHLLAEFGALAQVRYATFTTAIYDQYRSSFAGPAAAALASVLVVVCLALLVVEQGASREGRTARVGAGAPRAHGTAVPGHRWPLTALLAAVTSVALVVPAGILGYWLFLPSARAFDGGRLLSAGLSTIGLGASAALLTMLLSLPVAWLSVRHRGPLAIVVERSTWFASALPGIVVALALVTLAIRHARPLYQTVVVLLAAYVVLYLPRATTNARAALAQSPVPLDEAARSLGVGPLAAFKRVGIPLMAPGLAAGAALVFVAVCTELTSTLLLAPTGTRTLATEFWSRSSALEYSAAAPYAALLVAISAPAAWLVGRASRGAQDVRNSVAVPT